MESEKKQCCGECKHFLWKDEYGYYGHCVAPIPIWLRRSDDVSGDTDADEGHNCPAFTPRKDNEK